jgi:hypothetical protein
LKAHDFRLDEELSRLRGLTALGPVSAREFSEGSHLVVIGIKDLEEFQLAVLERTTAYFWWMLSGPMAQFADREGHARVSYAHVETFDGEDIPMGTWVNSRRSDYKKGKLSQDRIDALEALPGWEWDPFEADYQRGLAVLKQFVDREGHARVRKKYVETFDGKQIELGSWVHARRQGYNNGKLAQDRIDALEALPGWEWDKLEADYQRSLNALKQFVDREGHARVSYAHVETFDGEDIPMVTWVNSRRSDYAKGKLSQDRIDALEALTDWEWDQRQANFRWTLLALTQFVDREGHARVPDGHVETFDGEKIKLGVWVTNRRMQYNNGKLAQDRIDALEALPGWEWDKLEANYQRSLNAVTQFAAREGHALVPSRHVESFDGKQILLGGWVYSRRGEYEKGKLSQDRIDALEALPGWEWNKTEADYQRGLAVLKQFVDREGHARVPSGHVESFDGEKLRLGSWVGRRRMKYAQRELSQDCIDALEALPGWEWNKLEADYQRGLAVLKQFVDREGHARVPSGHVESFDGEEIRLGSRVSVRRRDYAKGKLSQDRIDALEALPGWVWKAGGK